TLPRRWLKRGVTRVARAVATEPSAKRIPISPGSMPKRRVKKSWKKTTIAPAPKAMRAEGSRRRRKRRASARVWGKGERLTKGAWLRMGRVGSAAAAMKAMAIPKVARRGHGLLGHTCQRAAKASGRMTAKWL